MSPARPVSDGGRRSVVIPPREEAEQRLAARQHLVRIGLGLGVGLGLGLELGLG